MTLACDSTRGSGSGWPGSAASSRRPVRRARLAGRGQRIALVVAALDDGASVRVEMVRQVLDAEHEERRCRVELPRTIEHGCIDDLDVAQPLDVELDAGPVGLDQDGSPATPGERWRSRPRLRPSWERPRRTLLPLALNFISTMRSRWSWRVRRPDHRRRSAAPGSGGCRRARPCGQQVGVDDALLQERQGARPARLGRRTDERAGAVQVTGIWRGPSRRWAAACSAISSM